MGERHAKTAVRPRRRARGRPGGAEHAQAVRRRLLDAAHTLFAARDFNAVSVREIARAARVNPAMVHYHYGDKRGLYKAMLEQTLGPILTELQARMADPAADARTAIRGILREIMTVMAREPWVARLILREVLVESGPFRKMFIRDFAARGGGRVPALLSREIAQGRVRADLDVKLGALSLVSLTLFPFIARPVAERVFGLKMTDAVVARLIEHSERLFYEGVAPPAHKLRATTRARTAKI